MKPHQWLRGTSVTDSRLQVTNIMDSTNDDDEPGAKCLCYLKLTSDQLSQLIVACSSQLASQGGNPSLVLHHPSTTPAYIANANYEEICCRPIKPIYKGTKDDLMPFLLLIDIC
jgi:hypothetical protein